RRCHGSIAMLRAGDHATRRHAGLALRPRAPGRPGGMAGASTGPSPRKPRKPPANRWRRALGGAPPRARREALHMTYRANPLPLPAVWMGLWYFGFGCLACALRFAVLEAASGGQRPLKFAGDALLQALCPHCSVDGLYHADQLRQFQSTAADG